MSEQTANLCTTDACESLRARLAKYEDAEGRPLGGVGADRESIRRQFDAFVAWPGSDHSTVTTTTCLLFAEQIAALVRAEFAEAMKAQPSGVVLPERIAIAGHLTAEQSYRASGHNECLDKIARLNSSPVSAGDERAAFEASGLKSSASIWKEGCYQFKTIDENGDEYFTAGLGLDNIKWKAWQARAALSAPSHGEQVREGWQLVPVEPTAEMVAAAVQEADRQESYWRYRGKDFWSAMLASAPSAGSQKEQGE